MSFQKTIEIIVNTDTRTIFAIVLGDCKNGDIKKAAKQISSAKLTRTNIACGDDVPMSVINYAIQKFCTEVGTSSVYVDAPKHNRSEMIFPEGVRIQL
jgi:hypothetical protein